MTKLKQEAWEGTDVAGPGLVLSAARAAFQSARTPSLWRCKLSSKGSLSQVRSSPGRRQSRKTSVVLW